MIQKLIIIWLICFAVFLIVVNGMGIFDFEIRTSDIERFIDDTESVIVQQRGWRYIPQSETACLLFDFSETHINEAVYGIVLTLGDNADPGNIAAYLEENVAEIAEGNWQNVTIGRKNDKLTMMFTKGYSRLRLCIDQPLDIVSFAIITKSNMVLPYIIVGVIALGISVLYVYLVRGRFFGASRHVQILSFLKNRKAMSTLAIIIMEGVLICSAETVCYLCIDGSHFNPYRVFLLGCMAAFLTVVLRHKESVVGRFHVFYFFLMIMTGTIYIVGCAPYSLDLSWDDQIHYARANYVARGGHSYETEAGYQLKEYYFDRGTNEVNFTKEQRRELAEYIGSLDKNKDYGGLRYVESYYSLSSLVSYLPAAIGLAVGRGLRMSTTMSLLLGRWVNLLCYSLIFSYSVWLLRNRGYVIAAFIGMIPPTVYIASNYSYDWWITSLSVLGFAIFEYTMQDKKELCYRSIYKVMIVMFLAFLPKAVYLAMLIPILAVLVAKGKKGKKGIFAVVIIMLMLAASFMIPLFVSGGAAYSDPRGGNDVNAAGQIQFILMNPIRYLMILARFLWRYINPDKCVETFGYYILFGTGKYYSIVLILLVLGTFVDNINNTVDEPKKINMLRLWSLIGIMTTLVLISTSLYVSFTPVGENDINGVQPRYMIPLLFPFLYYVCRVNIDIPQKIKNNVAVYGSMLMALIFCFNIYVQCICFY